MRNSQPSRSGLFKYFSILIRKVLWSIPTSMVSALASSVVRQTDHILLLAARGYLPRRFLLHAYLCRRTHRASLRPQSRRENWIVSVVSLVGVAFAFRVFANENQQNETVTSFQTIAHFCWGLGLRPVLSSLRSPAKSENILSSHSALSRIDFLTVRRRKFSRMELR